MFSSLKVNCTFGYPTECAAIVVNNKMVKFVNLLFWFCVFQRFPDTLNTYLLAGASVFVWFFAFSDVSSVVFRQRKTAEKPHSLWVKRAGQVEEGELKLNGNISTFVFCR